MENAARRQLGEQISKANGAMPIEDIKNETTRIITARNQLENQTLDPKARQAKEWKDLLSIGEKLRPQTTSSMVKPSTDVTTLLNNIPLNVPNDPVPNPDNLTFPSGNVPSTGYGIKIDPISAKTIDDYYDHPENFSKPYIVKDPNVSSMMRLVQQEQINNGGKGKGIPTTGNPNDALRVYVKEQTPDGVVVRPMGYIPQEASFDAKTNPLNKLYFQVMNRLRTTINSSSTLKDL